MPYYFIETLNHRNWQREIWPYLRREHEHGRLGAAKLYYVEGDTAAVAEATRVAGQIGVVPEQLVFDAAHIYDKSGMLIWLRIYYEDMIEALQFVIRLPAFEQATATPALSINLRTWLKKRVLPGTVVWSKDGLWRALYLLHVYRWQARGAGEPAPRVVAFFDRRVWIEGLGDYAMALGDASIVPVGQPGFSVKHTLARLLRPALRAFSDRAKRIIRGKRPRQAAPAACVALQYYGHFNLDRPERHSDFFFWQQSDLAGRNLLALFGIPQDPVDAARHAAMAQHDIRALAVRFDAATTPAAPVFLDSLWRQRVAACRRVLTRLHCTPEEQWLHAETATFEIEREYWKRLFMQNNVKVFTTWYKYSADHCAIAEAIQGLGGVLAVYQRSYEGNPTAQATLAADIAFVFSGAAAAIESHAHSNIRYCVTTGYLGDHRPPLVKAAAHQVRNDLLHSGARFIAAYFDEGSFADARWGIANGRLRTHYAFLLERILREPEFGLVLKPKTPRTLRERLGPVADKLDRALATGRCYLYADGVLQAAIPPVQAALSADLVIHCSVAAGTAAVEAALAGVPTVLLDDDGWIISPLYRLDRDRVIFNDWEVLWHTWGNHRAQTGGMPGFGDWSALLDSLDPFRDGRAAERMGTYLKWLIEGLESGLSRDTALADTAERYSRTWGANKVTAVHPAPAMQPRLR